MLPPPPHLKGDELYQLQNVEFLAEGNAPFKTSRSSFFSLEGKWLSRPKGLPDTSISSAISEVIQFAIQSHKMILQKYAVTAQ